MASGTQHIGMIHLTAFCACLLLASGAYAQRNVAAGRPVQASSSYQHTAATKAVDDVISDDSRWIAQGPSTLVIELDDEKTLVAGDLYSGAGHDAPVEDFRFEVEANGRWVEIPGGKVRDNDQLAIRVAFERPVVARRVRLVIEKPGPEHLGRVREVRLWDGSLDKLPALEQPPGSQINPVFDLTRHQIFLNQSGFNTGWPKRFTAPLSDDGTAFAISPLTDNRILFSGIVTNHIGDFTSFCPEDPQLPYRITLTGGTLSNGISDSFFVAPLWFERVTMELAAQFFVDTRSVTGSYPGGFGQRAWRDSPYYAYSVPSLVNLYLANPSFYNQSAIEMNWQRDLTRVLSPEFKLDPAAADGVMDTVRTMYGTLDGPVGDRVPDIVQLIHWGISWDYTRPVSHDFAGSETKLHPEMLSEFAYFLYGLPDYGKYFTPKYIETMRAFAYSHWEGAGLFEVNKTIGTFKGREAPGWSILPNLMMYEVARRAGHPQAERFLKAAIAQADWCVEALDLEDPLVTKGQRMSEHKSVSGLATLLKFYPGQAPRGLREHLRKRADIAIRRSANLWDFRKYDDGANWSLPHAMPGMTGGGKAWNEPGNLAGFPYIAWEIAAVLGDQSGDDARIGRLNELAVANFDNLFGRNPLGFHSSWRGPLDFKGVERGWSVKYRPACAYLETVRGALNSSAATEHYPFNPAGAFRHPEGWTAFNAALNMGLVAAIRHDSAINLKRTGDMLDIELRAPVFRPTATVTVEPAVSAGNSLPAGDGRLQGADWGRRSSAGSGPDWDVVLTATDYRQDTFRGHMKLDRIPENAVITVSHGFGYFATTATLNLSEK